MARFALVVSMKNVYELNGFDKNLVQKLKSSDILIIVCQDLKTYEYISKTLKVPRDITFYIVHMKKVGLSKGRNEGINFLLNQEIPCDYVLFPNLLTVYPDSTLNFLRNSVLINKNILYIGSWIDKNYGILMMPHFNYNKLMKFSRIYEPSMVVPLDCFKEGFRFDPRIGTGAKTMLQSGEGSDLVYRLFKKGYQVNGSREIVAMNPGTSRDLGLWKSTLKAFKYGYGNGGFYAHHAAIINYPAVLIRLVAPFLAYIFGKKYWRTEGLIFSGVSTLGRIFGFICEIISKCFSPSTKYQR